MIEAFQLLWRILPTALLGFMAYSALDDQGEIQAATMFLVYFVYVELRHGKSND